MKNIFFIGLISLLTACNKQPAGNPDHADRIKNEPIQGVGYVEPVSEVRRLSFLHPGVVAAVLTDVGTEVKQGVLLMRQRDYEEQAAVAIAQAECKQTLAGVNVERIHALESSVAANSSALEYASAEYHRSGDLYKSGSISQADLDRSKTSYTVASNNLLQAESELKNLRGFVREEDRAVAKAKLAAAQARLAEAELRAPFDGQVLEILRREGESTYDLANEPVIIFANVKKLRVRAEIEESYSLNLKAGQEANVIVRNLQRTAIKGKVVLVKQIMGKKTVFAKTSTERRDVDVLQVFIDLPEATDLPIGMEVDVMILNDL